MNRRKFFRGLAGSLVIAGFEVEGQPASTVHRVGFLLGATGASVASLFNSLKEGLRDLGYVEGRNVVFEQRYAEGKMERLPDLAAELVRLRVEVIVTGTNLHVSAARGATSTIPIVMIFAEDPVGSGFVASLSRPGGNVTGLSAEASSELWGKYLTLLREVVPRLSRVGVIGQVSSKVGFAELAIASRKLDMALEIADLRNPDELESAFGTLVARQVQGVLLVVGPLTYLLMQPIGALAIKYRLPTITNAIQFSQAGLLMSYGPNLHDLYRRAATYVDKILRGTRPADLPVQQPSHLELAINLNTAKALGITIPQSMLLRADEVIQ